jgi:putative addiction module component (TIGR02574 family)
MSLADIQNAVSDLSALERGTLAAWLLDSLPPHSEEDASAESVDEAARRREELDSGRVQPLSSDEFWASIERLRATWK